MITEIFITLLVLLSTATTIINIICIYVIIHSKKLFKRPSTILLLNLLFVHLIQGVVVFPFYAAKKANNMTLPWIRITCDGFRVTYMVTFYLAIIGVLLIAIDRMLATWYVLKYKEIVTKRRLFVTLLLFWLYVVVLCLIPFEKGNSTYTKSVIITQLYNNTVINNTEVIKTFTSKCNYNQTRLWTTLMLIVNCVTPYVIIVILYQVILRRIQSIENKSRSRRSTTVTSIDNSGLTIKEETKRNKTVTKISIILSVAYMIFWAPSVIYYLLLHFCPDTCFQAGYHDSQAETYVSFFIKYLAFLDALAAPSIYCLFHKEFRKQIHVNIDFYKLATPSGKRHSYPDKEMTIRNNHVVES